MKIAQVYSHLNGLEFLLVHRPELWNEVKAVIQNVDASLAFNKVSREKTMTGRILFAPTELNRLFKAEFLSKGWRETRIDYFVNEDLETTRDTVHIRDKDRQRQAIE